MLWLISLYAMHVITLLFSLSLYIKCRTSSRNHLQWVCFAAVFMVRRRCPHTYHGLAWRRCRNVGNNIHIAYTYAPPSSVAISASALIFINLFFFYALLFFAARSRAHFITLILNADVILLFYRIWMSERANIWMVRLKCDMWTMSEKKTTASC